MKFMNFTTPKPTSILNWDYWETDSSLLGNWGFQRLKYTLLVTAITGQILTSETTAIQKWLETNPISL